MRRSRLICIALVSGAALIFQVAQTRLFSASYGYHLTYHVGAVASTMSRSLHPTAGRNREGVRA